MGGEVVFHFFGGGCGCCCYTIGLRDALHLKTEVNLFSFYISVLSATAATVLMKNISKPTF